MIDNYVKLVESCRKKESGKMLKNFSTTHAVTLFQNLLEIAEEKKESVTIYSGRLNKEFYERLTETVKKTLKESKVLVAVAKDPGESQAGTDNSFANAIRESDKGRIEQGTENLLGEGFPHFILVGDKRYRLEKDDKTREAVACFNDPIVGDMLKQASKKLEARSSTSN